MKVNIGKYRVKGKAQISLADYGTRPPEGLDRQTVQDVLMPAVIEEIKQYQEKLSAENTRAIILVLQGMDAAGKDGTVKRVFAKSIPQDSESSPSRRRPMRSGTMTICGALIVSYLHAA